MEKYDWRTRVVNYSDLSDAERDELLLVLPTDGRLLVLDMPNEMYHRGPGVSSSGLKRMTKSPWAYQHGGQEEETDAMALGTLCHTALLEPEKLNEELFALLPTDENGKDIRRDKRTKAYQEFLADIGERIQVRHRDWETAQKTAASVRSHPAFMAWMESDAEHFAEVSVYWLDPASGVLCRCRPDLLTIPRDDALPLTCWDLKTTKDSGYSAVQFHGEKYGHWPLQASFYTEGLRQFFQREASFNIIAAERDGAMETNIYQYEAQGCVTPIGQIGRAQVREALDKVAACTESGQWPRQQEGIADMEPSAFLSRQYDPETLIEDPEPF